MSGKYIACIKRVEPKSDFTKIKKECLAKKKLFEDPDFPANNKSVYHSKEPSKKIVWMRPREILKRQGVNKEPIFVSKGSNRFDLKQGELGDCWMLASAASVVGVKDVFNWLAPPDQTFAPDSYAGIFRFRFFQYGDWVEIFVDDRIPVHEDGTYLFTHSSKKNVFWSCLLEKAFAKLCSSYEAMEGGTNEEALMDFTGGLVEHYDNQDVTNLRRLLRKSFAKCTIVACGINGDLANPVLKNGLVVGHAYSVTGYGEVKKKEVDKKEFLVRVRNPWGTEDEWNGTWSDTSTEWSNLTDESKEVLGIKKSDDGEFWMSVADFRWQFDDLTVCNYVPDDVEADHMKNWKVTVYHNAWKKGVTDGGLPETKEAFDKNKQYLIKVEDYDEDGLASIIIQLTQKNRRRQHRDMLVIGLIVIKKPAGAALPLTFEYANEDDGKKNLAGQAIGGGRDVTKRLDVEPGEYVVMPITQEPGQEAEYMLRIFSESAIDASEVK